MKPAKTPPLVSKTKILFLCEAVSLSHVVRPLVIASGLDASRYEIHIACPTSFHWLFADSSFTLHPLECVSPQVFHQALLDGKIPYNERVLRSYVTHDRSLIKKVQPDYVVGDFRLTSGLSSQIEGVPSALISNSYWSPYLSKSFPVPDCSIARLLSPTLLKPIFPIVAPVIFRQLMKPMNKIRREFGVQPFSTLHHWYTDSDRCFYADIPAQGNTDLLPDHHQYIGPILWSPPGKLPEWWDSIDESKPLVYLSMGSSGGLGPLPKIIAALGDLDVNVMFATADRVQDLDLPKNFWSAEYLPGELAAKRSQLMIGNGGGANYQALKHGVPIIGLPSNLDQFLNMKPIVERGAGLLIRNDRATQANIKKAIVEVLNSSSYESAAMKISHECEAYDPNWLFEKHMLAQLQDSKSTRPDIKAS